MRLIDADYIPYTMLYKENWMKGTGEEAQGAWKRDIDKMPTIDAVPVIRCKDCRFYRFYDGTFGKGWMCFENNTARHGDDYCSRGERKDK